MDKNVKDSLTTTPGYQGFYDRFDVLEIWNLSQQVVLERGAISVYTLIVRLLKHAQDSSYTNYEKMLKEMEKMKMGIVFFLMMTEEIKFLRELRRDLRN